LYLFNCQNLVYFLHPRIGTYKFFIKRHGVHVRPGKSTIYESQSGRKISHFENMETALKFVDARSDLKEKLIFLHSGRYNLDPIVISSAVQIIGASAGVEAQVMRNVVLEGILMCSF